MPHRLRYQLPKSLRGALLGAGTQVFFRVSHADATALAVELAANRRQQYTEILTSLARGEAVARIGASPPSVVAVPAGTHRTRGTDHAAYVLRALSLHRYARRRDEIEQHIRQRSVPSQPESRVPKAPANEDHQEGQLDW